MMRGVLVDLKCLRKQGAANPALSLAQAAAWRLFLRAHLNLDGEPGHGDASPELLADNQRQQ